MLIAAVLLAATSARADNPSGARAHYEEGTKLYDLGRYADAAHEYEEAFRLHPDPALLFNIGQAYRQAGDDEAALRAYRGFLRRFPEYEKRNEVEGYIKQLQQRLDDKRKAAEEHERQEQQRQEQQQQQLLQQQEQQHVAPAPAPAPVVVAAEPPRDHTPVYKKWWLWTIVGVVVVGGGAAALAVALTTPKNAPSPAGTMTLVFP
jgi:tetratricopeptide (TPR) repeat protein